MEPVVEMITIGFKNDSRQIPIAWEIVNQYPHSAIYGYIELSDTNSIILDDISYEDFCVVEQVMLRRMRQWKAPENIQIYADDKGLVNDIVNKVYKELKSKRDRAMETVDDFITGDHPMMIAYDMDMYEIMENVLRGNNNFVSIQISFFKDRVICIHLSGMIPIYRNFTGFSYFKDDKISAFLPAEDVKIVDIFDLREKMFFTDSFIKLALEKKCDTGESNFYSMDTFKYLYAIKRQIKMFYEFEVRKLKPLNKQREKEYYDFTVNFNDEASKDIRGTLEKIISHILKSVGRIPITTSPDINVVVKNVGSNCRESKYETYLGFVNLDNLPV